MTGRFVRAPRVVWRTTLDGVLLRPLGAADVRPVLLNGSGGLLWNALATPTCLETLCEHLAAETGSDPAVIAADIRPVLDHLVRTGLIVAVG
jgi:hypothetical protein